MPADLQDRFESALIRYALRGESDVTRSVGAYRIVFSETATEIVVEVFAHRGTVYRREDAIMGAPRFITTEGGEELVVLSRRDHDELVARAEATDAEEDALLFAAAEEVRARRERGEEGVVVWRKGDAHE